MGDDFDKRSDFNKPTGAGTSCRENLHGPCSNLAERCCDRCGKEICSLHTIQVFLGLLASTPNQHWCVSCSQQFPNEYNRIGHPCFLTTAIVELRGELDDGDTMQTMRSFRDSYLASKRGDVEEYYEIAPIIVSAFPNDHPVWVCIGEQIDECVTYIKEGKNEEAYEAYKKMVLELKADCLQ